jgi:hypothetical protein
MSTMLTYDCWLQPVPFMTVFKAVQQRIDIINDNIDVLMSKERTELQDFNLTKLEQERDCLVKVKSVLVGDASAVYYCQDDKMYIPYILSEVNYLCDDVVYDKSKHRWIMTKREMPFSVYRGIIDFEGIYPNVVEGRERQIQLFIKARHNTLKGVCDNKNKRITGGKKNMVTTYIEKGDKKLEFNSIIEACKNNCRENGGKVKELNKVTVYIKPEESKAYWTLGDLKGFVPLVFAE